MNRVYGLLLGCIGLLTVVGCDDTPKAPAIVDSPVFHDEREGFRFLVPEDWKLSSRAELPSGRKFDREHLFAQYQRQPPKRPVTLEVIRFDNWDSSTLRDRLPKSSHGCSNWTEVGKQETKDLQGTPAHRFVFQGSLNKLKMTKEIVACKRGDRGYWFVAIYELGDLSARDQYLRILDSVIWEK
jgi:hypothetical protein